jgi:cytochrome P450
MGHVIEFKRDPISFLKRVRGLGEGVVEIRLGPKPAYVVNDEELVRKVFVSEAHHFTKGVFWDKVAAIIGNGLATSSGAEHLKQRRLMQPVFHRERIATYANTMAQEWERRVAAWEDGQAFDVVSTMNETALTMAAKTIFSSQIGERAVEVIRTNWPVVQDGVMWRMMNPFPVLEKLPIPANRRFTASIEEIWRSIGEVITAYREDGVDRGDLLSMLVAARDQDTGETMGDVEIRNQVLTIALAAGETTGNILSWALYRIGQEPEVGQRIADEVAAVAGDGPLTFEDIGKLDFTNRFIQEILRYYPFWMLMRRANEEIVLGDVRITEGAQVILSPVSMHRDPALFADPDTFDPDRFLPERAADIRRTSYVPFGAGQHQCIGDRFALTETALGLAAICRRFTPKPVAGQVTKEQILFAIIPKPLRMTFETR